MPDDVTTTTTSGFGVGEGGSSGFGVGLDTTSLNTFDLDLGSTLSPALDNAFVLPATPALDDLGLSGLDVNGLDGGLLPTTSPNFGNIEAGSLLDQPVTDFAPANIDTLAGQESVPTMFDAITQIPVRMVNGVMDWVGGGQDYADITAQIKTANPEMSDTLVAAAAIQQMTSSRNTRSTLILTGLGLAFQAFQDSANREEAADIRQEDRDFITARDQQQFENAMALRSSSGGGSGNTPGGAGIRRNVEVDPSTVG